MVVNTNQMETLSIYLQNRCRHYVSIISTLVSFFYENWKFQYNLWWYKSMINGYTYFFFVLNCLEA
jgi:hypothetical protein